ncbi:tyrosine-type recombinase/integrase [Salinimonas sediminis]|uniref:Tyr recombinase domain-containing protein n=1 Tax=Salinimonas sediminis TaxID=2303538 RepID=A0A346NNC4_9ALTE|nr:site-specific integrase [Salinimonas sediminis]AXR07031.1 hypothetical protein D0Y50_12130 [Salinimonas sediminis]
MSRAFRADVRPTIGNIKLKELSRLCIIQKCLDPIKKRGGSVQANKTLSLLKQTLQFGVERGLLETNPLSGTRRINIGGKEQPRNRFLSLDEIEYFFNWLKTSTASIQVKQSFKLLLLTGCRAQELTLSEWTHIDWENKVWLFPESNRKGNKGETKDHIVPLTDPMTECLIVLKQAHKDLQSKYVFPSTTGQVGQKPVDRAVCAKFLRRRFDGDQPELEMERFVPHDLRRSFQTHLSKLGVDAIVCEKLLSHELQGMLRVYNQNDYIKEREEALAEWSELVGDYIK